MSDLLGGYQNGNYKVSIYADGTKIRENKLDFFEADFPENMDVKITNQCEMGCPYCHEDSKLDGMHGDILNQPFIDTLTPFTEMAIGGGNPLSHPDLIPFLYQLVSQGVIPNITVNQKHFMENENLLELLSSRKLIYGLGVSLTQVTPDFIRAIKRFPNAVIHIINGIVSKEDLESLYDHDLKILILGYKSFRNGIDYYTPKIEEEKMSLYKMLDEAIKHFKVVSFDNLALEQLQTKRLLSDAYWNEFYMGDDGAFTMYVDLVEQTYAKNSISNIRYMLLDDIGDMFKKIKMNNRRN